MAQLTATKALGIPAGDLQAPDGQLFLGDCREVMAGLPAESIHCVVTSPPYWGLRDYKIAPGIWGGDAGCTHHWGPGLTERKRGRLAGATATVGNTIAGVAGVAVDQGFFCIECGAWLGALGSEPTIQLYVAHLVEVFAGVWRVLRKDGSCWVNMGDTWATGKGSCRNPGGGEASLGKQLKEAGAHPLHRLNISDLHASGLKAKDLVGAPWRVALALQEAGWWLRAEVIWSKPNPLPESAKDRPGRAHEQVFLLTKGPRYYYDAEAVKQPVTGEAHSRGKGLSPKAMAIPTGWDISVGDGGHGSIHLAGRGRIRQNESFSKAIAGWTDQRHLRSVWNIPTMAYKGSHYATYPPALVRVCILAGTPEKGCCSKCGMPWRRVVDSAPIPDRPGRLQRPGQDGLDRAHGPDGRNGKRHSLSSATVGWEPACNCQGAGISPAVVLDPFMGSGTTGAVARSLGRHWLGIEIKQSYLRQAIRRIGAITLGMVLHA